MRRIFGETPHFDWHIVLVTILSTMLLILDAYHQFTPAKIFDRLGLYFVIPLITIIVVFREHPGSYGMGLGDWRAGSVITGMAVILIAPVIWLTARQPDMQSYYASQLAGLPWTTFVELVGWEFFFRGFILFAYARRFGPDAVWLQAVPFALAHIGKPEIETLSTIFGGFFFGWLAYRTRSFLYPFLLHWFVASFTILVAAGTWG